MGKAINIYMLIISRNSEKNNPTYLNGKRTSLEIKEVEMKMYQSNTHRKDLNWICFGNALKG